HVQPLADLALATAGPRPPAGRPVAHGAEGAGRSAAHGVHADHVAGGQCGDLLHDTVGDGGTAAGRGVAAAAPGALACGALRKGLLRVGASGRGSFGHVGHRRYVPSVVLLTTVSALAWSRARYAASWRNGGGAMDAGGAAAAGPRQAAAPGRGAGRGVDRGACRR